MSKSDNLILAVVTTAILHNGTRYGIGDEISLTEAEFDELSLYVQPQEAALAARKQAELDAQETAEAFARQAQQERDALEHRLAEAETAHAQAEALATENGLRAEHAEAKVVELQTALAEKDAEIASLQKALAKKEAKTAKAVKTENDANKGEQA